MPEFTGYKLQTKEFRFYAPAGTKSVMFAGYAPQRAIAAFAMRFGQPPERSSALSTVEYLQAQEKERVDQSFPKLYNGGELVVVHDGGGTVRFLGGTLSKPSAVGGWVYVRQLMGDPLYDIQVALDVDVDMYAKAYASMEWDSLGDPTGNSVVIPNPPIKDNVSTVNVQVMSQDTEAFRLKVSLHQTQPDIANNPLITIWLAGYVNDTFFFRTAKNTWTSDLSNADGAARVLYAPNQSLIEFETAVEFTAGQLRRENVVIFLAYRTNSEPFKNIGVVWS